MLEQFFLPKDDKGETELMRLKSRLGMTNIAMPTFIVLSLFWLTIFCILFFGLCWMIISVLIFPLSQEGQKNMNWDWRFSVLKLASLTAVLVAVVALPFTAIRLKLSHEQNHLALEAIYNDRINTAVIDLYAQRQVTEWKDRIASNGWEGDITRRNGAIDRLRGLVEENNALLPRVDWMLTVYLREMTEEYPPKSPPLDATPDEIQKWAAGLSRVRSDMENAVRTLSQLPRRAEQLRDKKLPDLQKINMQAFNLAKLHLSSADLTGAYLQGANLREVQLQNANIQGAYLQKADLTGAQLQESDLRAAQLQWAGLRDAQLQGADLREAQLQGANLVNTQLQRADLRGARWQGADLTGVRWEETVFTMQGGLGGG